jgi:hypothetical protein
LANEKCLARLKQGVEAWKQRQKGNPDTQPDLTEVYLWEVDLAEEGLDSST